MEERAIRHDGPAPGAAARTATRERSAQAHVRGPGPDAQRLEGRRRPKALTPERREMVVQSLMADHGMSERRACSASGIARSTLRYRPVPRDDSGVISFIQSRSEERRGGKECRSRW